MKRSSFTLILVFILLFLKTTLIQGQDEGILDNEEPAVYDKELNFEVLGSAIGVALVHHRDLHYIDDYFKIQLYIGGAYLPENLSLFGENTLTTMVGFRTLCNLDRNAYEFGLGYTNKYMYDNNDSYHFAIFRLGYRRNSISNKFHWNLTYTPVLLIDELQFYRSGESIFYYFVPFLGTSFGFKF